MEREGGAGVGTPARSISDCIRLQCAVLLGKPAVPRSDPYLVPVDCLRRLVGFLT